MFDAEIADSITRRPRMKTSAAPIGAMVYTNGLDVYRPLNNIKCLDQQGGWPRNLADLSAGFFDVWALDAGGQVWAHCIRDGAPDSWTSVSRRHFQVHPLAVGRNWTMAFMPVPVTNCPLCVSTLDTPYNAGLLSLMAPHGQLSANGEWVKLGNAVHGH